MNPQEIAIVAIVFGSIVSIVFLAVVGGLIKTWIKNKSGKNLSENDEFLSALREFKEKTDRRLSNLETIVTEERENEFLSERPSEKMSPKEKQNDHLEIELDDDPEDLKESGSGSGKLKNMLNQ
jgi:ribosomal protein S21